MFPLATEKEVAEHFVSTMEPEEKQYVLDVPDRKFMSMFHDTAGRHIRNEYNIWNSTYWKPEIVDGVDVSPQHPDAISGRILELIWDLCHEK